MEAKGRKYIALFLIFSLVILSVNLYAKERRGAKLIITKKDRTQFQGELITVKQNSLLILVPEGKDVSFDISDIFSIRVVKKSKAKLGSSIGLLIGGGIGVAVGLNFPEGEIITDEAWAVLVGATFGCIGGLLGKLIGAIAGTDKTFHFEGMTDSEIQETLEKLRKKARVRDYK